MTIESATFWRNLCVIVGAISAVTSVLLGTYGYKFFDDKLKDARAAAAPFRYFGRVFDPATATAEDLAFVTHLNGAKGKADRLWLEQLGGTADSARVRIVNDYTFRAYRDLYFIQKQWLELRNRYFQGRPTMGAG